MLTAIMSVAVPLALWILDRFFLSKAQDDESRKLLIRLAQIVRSMGITRASSRFEAAEDQIDAGNAEWDKRKTDMQTKGKT